jgi:hypothetical protein
LCLIGNGVVLSPEALIKEMEFWKEGVPVKERLRISPNCPLILPNHIALDQAREKNVVMPKLVRLVVVLVQRMKIKWLVVLYVLQTWFVVVQHLKKTSGNA